MHEHCDSELLVATAFVVLIKQRKCERCELRECLVVRMTASRRVIVCEWSRGETVKLAV